MNFSNVITSAIALAFAAPLCAQEADAPKFETGPVFADFGPHAPVEGLSPFREGVQFAVAFDAEKAAEGEGRNRQFESAARFINMHVANGVPRDSIRIAVVVHGAALRDLLTDEKRAALELGETNPSGGLVRALLDEGVAIIVCGQSMAGSGLAPGDFIEGVQIELSAMTAHALLQQQGYTVNPF